MQILRLPVASPHCHVTGSFRSMEDDDAEMAD
jgi:hypothetical protein